MYIKEAREGGKCLTFYALRHHWRACALSRARRTEPCAPHLGSLSIKRGAGWRLLFFFCRWSRVRQDRVGSGERCKHLWSGNKFCFFLVFQKTCKSAEKECQSESAKWMSSWQRAITRTIVCKRNNIGIWQVAKNLFSLVIKIWIILKSVVPHLLELFGFN